MTSYGGKQLAEAFRTVRKNTIQIAEEIPENKYAFRAAPDCRTIAQTLVHIAVGPTLALQIHRNRVTELKDFNFPAFMQEILTEEAKPRTKAEIVAMLRSEGEAFASFLEGLDESFLAEVVAMRPGVPGPATKTRFEMLLSPKEHEMHHRAQLMVLERIIGIVPHLTRQMQERLAQMSQMTGARP